jgi:2-haloacid dehalogenase
MTHAPNLEPTLAPAPAPTVLAFDVFGTVVDWHGTIVREIARIAPHVNGAEFARAWRDGYYPAMARTMASGEWRKLDDLHLEILISICPRFDLALDADQLSALNLVWHALTPWPDSVAALTRLKSKFIITPLSNGNISLLVDMAKKGGLPWDVVLSAEVFGAYKPDPRTYTGVGRVMDVPNNQVMLVATHQNDLDAAQDCGLRTAYIERPDEFGAGQFKDSTRQERHPLHFRDLGELADYFGC